MINTYINPVAKLISYGDCRTLGEWPDYIRVNGFTSEHIPELISMATDEMLNSADPDSSDVWAPLHAWRVLGLLKAEEAIEPLTDLFHMLDGDEWSSEELPLVYEMIGPKSIPALAAYLKDDSHDGFARTTAAHSLEKIGKKYPSVKEQCQIVLEEQLMCFKKNGPELNALLIDHLVEMQTLSALPTIKQAFDSDTVDLTVRGDLEDVEIDFGLREKRSTPRPRFLLSEEIISKLEQLKKNQSQTSKVVEQKQNSKVKIGRNDPCSCGSGKKYKECCLK